MSIRRTLSTTFACIMLVTAIVSAPTTNAQASRSIAGYAACMIFNLATFIRYNYSGAEAANECN